MSERDLLMIPGPIVFDPAVLRAMAKPTESHVAPSFIEVFGRTLEGLRQVFLSETGQPFVKYNIRRWINEVTNIFRIP